MKNILKPLAKSISISLGLTAAASKTDAAIHKKMFGSGLTTLIISNEEMNHIMKIVKCLEEPGLSIKGLSETINNEAKEQKGGFPRKLSGKKKKVLFPDIGWVKNFYHSPVHIFECVSEYIFELKRKANKKPQQNNNTKKQKR